MHVYSRLYQNFMFSTIFYRMIIKSWEQPLVSPRILYLCPISQCIWEGVSEGAHLNNSSKRVRMQFRNKCHVYSFFLIVQTIQLRGKGDEGKIYRHSVQYQLILYLVSFRFGWFRFVSGWFCFVSFRLVPFRFDRFRFVSIGSISFCFVLVSFRTLSGPIA